VQLSRTSQTKFFVPHCSIKPPVNLGFIFDASCNGTTREGVSHDHGLSVGRGYAQGSLKPRGGELERWGMLSKNKTGSPGRVELGEMKMKKALVLMLVGLTVAGCTQTERGAGIGAASGAIIGGIATGNVRGAAVGAAIGGVAGAVIGNVSEQPGQCYYRDRYGNRYIDACPRGY
jgi:hypothetical protein